MGSRVFQPTPRVLGALASPLRQDILVVLESTAPLSVAELARRIGRRPDTLYHHLRLLERAGLVRAAASDSTGGRPGSLWRVTSHPIRVSASGTKGSAVRHAERVVGAMARAGARDFQRAFRNYVAGKGPKPSGKRWCVWLDERELDEMEKALWDVIHRFRKHEPREDRSPFIVTWLLASVGGEATEPKAKGPGRAGASARPGRPAGRRAPSRRAGA